MNGLGVEQQKGFSLLELVIAMAVLAALAVVTVNVVKNQQEYSHAIQNEQYMQQVQSAFMTFVKTNGFLPCPDTTGDGKENRATTSPFECTLARGRIPFLELGVARTDAWQQPLFYAVNTKADSSGLLEIADPNKAASYFNNQGAPIFGFRTPPVGKVGGTGNYRICSEFTDIATGCPGSSTSLIEEFAIAVIVSFGQNGAATWNEINTGTSAGLDAAEAENIDNDQNFWLAEGSQRAGRAFDDQLFWILAGDVKYGITSTGGHLPIIPIP
ncbi:MAG: prepilin-type N-terminal cleavage/methylation domain-containing protein [Thiomicrorhabdus sp.]|nr:prepilin-type N-terminal cleavage/methylation domain-containing protein [Thiomicrorhabdus sp.]